MNAYDRSDWKNDPDATPVPNGPEIAERASDHTAGEVAPDHPFYILPLAPPPMGKPAGGQRK